MTAKKMEVAFRIVILTICFLNAVSSELLRTAKILKLIPSYVDLKGENGHGELLKYDLINPQNNVLLTYGQEGRGNELQRIRFDVVSAESGTPPQGDLPGIKVFPRQCKRHSPSVYDCLVPTANSDSSSNDACKWASATRDYLYTGMFLQLVKSSESSPYYMSIVLMFHDDKNKNFVGVQMTMFETPNSKEDIKLKDKNNVLVADTLIPIDKFTKKGKGNMHVTVDMSWMRDVLDRAKFIKSVKMSKPSGSHTDWYYAGALMVKPDVITKILQLDPRWEHHI